MQKNGTGDSNATFSINQVSRRNIPCDDAFLGLKRSCVNIGMEPEGLLLDGIKTQC